MSGIIFKPYPPRPDEVSDADLRRPYRPPTPHRSVRRPASTQASVPAPSQGRAAERKEDRASRFLRIAVLVFAVVGLLVVAAIMLLMLASFVQDITPNAGF